MQAVRRTACCHRLWLLPDARARGEGVFYPRADDVFLAAAPMGIGTFQDIHAGARAGERMRERLSGCRRREAVTDTLSGQTVPGQIYGYGLI